MNRTLWLSLSLTAASAVVCGADALTETLAGLDQAAPAFTAVSAHMKRLSHTAVINENTEDIGTLLLRKPRGKQVEMLIELTEPDKKSVALSGRKLEMYYPKIQTVQEFDLGKNRDLLEQFLLLGFGTTGKDLAASYRIRFVGKEMVGGQQTHRLELTPKSTAVEERLKKVELWIAQLGGYPAQQKFYLPGGDYSLVTYTEVKLNPPVTEAAVRLRLPKGVKREYPQR